MKLQKSSMQSAKFNDKVRWASCAANRDERVKSINFNLFTRASFRKTSRREQYNSYWVQPEISRSGTTKIQEDASNKPEPFNTEYQTK